MRNDPLSTFIFIILILVFMLSIHYFYEKKKRCEPLNDIDRITCIFSTGEQ